MLSNAYRGWKKLVALSGLAIIMGAGTGCDELAIPSGQSFSADSIQNVRGGEAVKLLTAKAAKKKATRR